MSAPGAQPGTLVLPIHPPHPKAAVLVLHGGREDSMDRSRLWHPPGLRMLPYVRALTGALSGAGAVVGRVRYRMRGWNGVAADPLRDTFDALQTLEDRCGALPVVLIGHSMGGRAALRACAHPAVLGAVALAPWTPEGEPAEQLDGRSLVIVHGERDRTTTPALSLAFARRARESGARCARLVVAGGDHAMLARARDWHAVAVAAVTGMLGLTTYPPLLSEAFDGRGPGDGLDVPLPTGWSREPRPDDWE